MQDIKNLRTHKNLSLCSSSSPTPPSSLMSNATTMTNASASAAPVLSAPLQPDPSLTTTPKRPNRFLGFFPPPAKPPLSPITSSPELSPNGESSPAFPARQKQLHLPHILSKLVPSGSLTSLVKVGHLLLLFFHFEFLFVELKCVTNKLRTFVSLSAQNLQLFLFFLPHL